MYDDAASPGAPADAAPTHALMSADALFPIVVWTTLHANLRHANRTIGHLERFLDADVKYHGENGICLTMLEGAFVFHSRFLSRFCYEHVL